MSGDNIEETNGGGVNKGKDSSSIEPNIGGKRASTLRKDLEARGVKQLEKEDWLNNKKYFPNEMMGTGRPYDEENRVATTDRHLTDATKVGALAKEYNNAIFGDNDFGDRKQAQNDLRKRWNDRYDVTGDQPNQGGGLDEYSGDGLINSKPVYEGIRSERVREIIKLFVDDWRIFDNKDGKFKVEMMADKDGKLWIEVGQGGKSGLRFQAWMLSMVLNVRKKQKPETEVQTGSGEFNRVHQKAAREEWEEFFNRIMINGNKMPEVEVELTGPWEKRIESPKHRKKETSREKTRGEVTVDLNRLGTRLENAGAIRSRVAKVIGRMEMKQGPNPSFRKGFLHEGIPMFDVGHVDKFLERVWGGDLLKVMGGEVSLMTDKDGNRHWSFCGLSVDGTSTEEEWQKFFDSMKIVRRKSVKAK